MKHTSSRRKFIQQSALIGAGFWIAGRASAESKSPNERIGFACIGLGNKGGGDCDQVAKHGDIVALCDLDDNVLAYKSKQYPRARTYSDFREMFENLGRTIDAVTVATPDHTHAIASFMAMELGKHVYCQKPLAHDVAEARGLSLSAQKNKVATQMGNQGMASEKFREGVEVIRSGMLGEVKEVHVWTNRAGGMWPQSPQIRKLPPANPVPKNLHWDLWLGTAPARPYARTYYHPNNWRGWWDFGGGAIGDMGCHTVNLPFLGLDLRHPVSVKAESEEPNEWTYPAWAKVEWEFAARGAMPAVTIIWYEGQKDGRKLLPPAELVEKVRGEYAKWKRKGVASTQPVPRISDSGSITIGTKGMMYSPDDYGGEWALLPMEAFGDYKKPARILPRLESSVGDMDERHKVEWIEAIRGGRPGLSDFEFAGPLTECILLGNVAVRESGKRLEWDGENMKFPNQPTAEKWLRRKYRKVWRA